MKTLNKASRTRSASTTRDLLLTAARKRFLEESYENVGLREVASDVGVDVALVSRYFGSKEDLFKEVLRSKGSEILFHGVNADNLPKHLVDLLIRAPHGDEGQNSDRLLIILRSASSPVAAELVRSALRDDLLEPMAAVLNGNDAAVRASLTIALLMGTTILRSIMAVEPICRGDGVLERHLLALFEATVSGSLPQGT